MVLLPHPETQTQFPCYSATVLPAALLALGLRTFLLIGFLTSPLMQCISVSSIPKRVQLSITFRSRNFIQCWSSQVSTWENGNESSTSWVPTFHGSFTSAALQTRDFMKQATIWTNYSTAYRNFHSEENGFHRGSTENRFCEAQEGEIKWGGVEKDQDTPRIHLKLWYRHFCVRTAQREDHTSLQSYTLTQRIWLME